MDKAKRLALQWACIYFLLGASFIYLTDYLLDLQISDLSRYSAFQTYKGIIFFAVTSGVFYLVVYRLLSQIQQKSKSLSYALESGQMATWDYVLETGNIIRSENHHILYGYRERPDEWSLSHFLKHIPNEDRDEVLHELLEAVNRSGKIDREIRIKTADGRISWRWLRGKVEHDAQGRASRISGVLIDIDDRKKAELGLRREEEFMEASINSVPGIFFVLDGEGRLVRWNDNTNALSGLPDEEIYKLHALERVEPVDREKALNALQTVMTEGEVETQLKLVTEKEGPRLYKMTARRFETSRGVFIAGCGIDVTELAEKQEKIRRQNYQLQSAQSIAKLGYWENDLADDKLKWTDGVYQLFDLDKESFEPTIDNFRSLIHPEDRDSISENLNKLRQHGTFENQFRIRKPGGQVGWFQERGEVFEWEDGAPRIIHGIVMDVTQQKETEKAIKKSLLEGENRERKRIANELHDGIAQYLSAAMLHFDGASLDSMPEKDQLKLQNVRNLITAALNETQAISQNLMPRNIETYGLIATIKSLIKHYRISTDIHFHFEYSEGSWDEQLSNETSVNLYRIIQETLSNAVRHAWCETIWIRLQKEHQELKCTIRDDGIGKNIPPISESSGLGLQSINNRVQLLSGTLELDSQPNRGTEVCIRIPIK